MISRLDSLRRRPGGALLLVLACVAGPCLAHAPSARECREAGEFIYHAAQARDAGMTREKFLGKLHEDLFAIRAFRPELRWFAQDAEDEALLVSAAERVFDAPQSDVAHRSAFEAHCMSLARR